MQINYVCVLRNWRAIYTNAIVVIQSFPIYTRIYCVWLSYVHSYHLWYQYALSTTRSETRKSFRPNDLILSDHLIMIVQLKTGWWSISDLCIIRIYFIHTTLFVHWAGPLFRIYMLNEKWRVINRRIFHKSACYSLRNSFRIPKSLTKLRVDWYFL